MFINDEFLAIAVLAVVAIAAALGTLLGASQLLVGRGRPLSFSSLFFLKKVMPTGSLSRPGSLIQIA